MEPIRLSSRLNRSSYKREKTFAYPISRADTQSPVSPLPHRLDFKENSAIATYFSKHQALGIESATDPPTPHILIPLRTSNSHLSIHSSGTKKILSMFDSTDSPCKTEVPNFSYKKQQSAIFAASFQSPDSKRSNLRGYSFSKATEKYEFQPESFEFAQLSARSGLYFKENSLEISAIVEENSLAEQNLPCSLSPVFKNASKFSEHSNSSNNPKRSKDLSESVLIEGYSSASVPISNRNNQEENLFRQSLPAKFHESPEKILKISFEEACFCFKSLKLDYFPQDLWIKSWADFLCCTSNEGLDEDSFEICEKLIVFAYSGYLKNNAFHVRLFHTVCEVLQGYTEKNESYTDIGFSDNSPMETDLRHDVASLGLFQLLFIDTYLADTFQELLTYSIENSMSFILIAFDISEICVTILRKKVLNGLILQSSKAMEIIFFMFAGCLIYWFTVHRTHHQVPVEVNLIVEKMALKHPESLINLARERWKEREL